jgi:3',5'-cyclic-AMP phosphodiesterase
LSSLAWITDPHLNFLDQNGVHAFCSELARQPTDAYLITGDLGEAPNVAVYLEILDFHLARPIYFVLGNHDFYRGSIARVREQINDVCQAHPNLRYLSRAGVIPLADNVCLIGHDGWADGRIGDYAGSAIRMNDWVLIEELTGMTAVDRLTKLHALGDEAAVHFRTVLPEALDRFQHVIVAIHVPPFRDACTFQGRISTDEWLPHMSCKAAGEVLAEAMAAHTEKQMTVYCGHTHGAGEVRILPNLHVVTGGAEYGAPKLQRLLAIEGTAQSEVEA